MLICVQGIIYTPYLGLVHPPIDVNTRPQTVLPHWGCVYCSSGVFVHSVGFYALVSLGDTDILSALVCLVSVCIITSVAYVSCKCSHKCIIQVWCTYGFIH